MIVHYPRFDVFVYCIYYDICTVLTLQSDFRNLKKQTRNEFGHTVKKATLIKITGMVDLVYSISLSVLSSGTLVSYRTKGLKHCFVIPINFPFPKWNLKSRTQTYLGHPWVDHLQYWHSKGNVVGAMIYPFCWL